MLNFLHTNSGGLKDVDLATLPSTMLHYYSQEDSIPKFILALEHSCEKLARGGVLGSNVRFYNTTGDSTLSSHGLPPLSGSYS